MLEQQAEQTAPQLTPQLAVVANASRRSMDAMSDIVWMINPNKDHLHDLTQRIRRFAGETLVPRNIAVTFALPDEAADIPITSESRREIFLLCKEAINNLARHSACTAAEITLTLDGTLMTLRVRDNGKGFVMNGGNGNGNGGQGLLSMRSRAEKLGGQLTITTPPDGGTEVVLRASLGA
jgi:signal transduction histidine kinase